MDREKRIFIGEMIEGDFENNTMKFKIDGEMILQAGNYTIMLTDDFNKLSEPTTEADTSEKANELIPDVSDMFCSHCGKRKVTRSGYLEPLCEC